MLASFHTCPAVLASEAGKSEHLWRSWSRGKLSEFPVARKNIQAASCVIELLQLWIHYNHGDLIIKSETSFALLFSLFFRVWVILCSPGCLRPRNSFIEQVGRVFLKLKVCKKSLDQDLWSDLEWMLKGKCLELSERFWEIFLIIFCLNLEVKISKDLQLFSG